MAYDVKLADRIRKYLAQFDSLKIEEKKMFGGIGFLVNGKMCVNVSGENLMCRFDPALQKEVTKKKGYQPVVMRSKEMTGYCYVEPVGCKAEKDFEYWIQLCLTYNERAKSSKKNKKVT